MATVRFSGALVNDILDNAKKTFAARIEEAERLPEDFGIKVYNWILHDYIDLISKMPSGFFLTRNTVVIKSFNDIEYINCTLSFGKELPWPNNLKGLKGLDPCSSSYSMAFICDTVSDTVACEIYEVLLARRDKLRRLISTRDEFVAGVDKICKAYATLAPALKAWSPLWDLVPDEYRARHLETKERNVSSASDALEDIDIDKLTATVMASKMTR